MRQYGSVPPWLGAGVAPSVKTATGLGTGGGASVQTPDGQGFGQVVCQIGKNPSASGSIVLQFPVAPPALFISGDEDFGALTVTGQTTTTVTIDFAGATLKPGSKPNLHYEWSVSK